MMSNNNHEQEIFPEAEQLIDWVNNDEIPNLIEAPENEDQGYCPCNIIEAISTFVGCFLSVFMGYWAWDEEFGNPLMDIFPHL